MDTQALLSILIFIVCYGLIVSEKIHRTIVAMVGASLVILLDIMDQETAIHHVDFNTLGLLIGMMILVNITAETGIFKWMGIRAARLAKGEPIRILVYLSIITAFGSAFLDNVTTIMLMVPVAISISRELKITPVPYIISLILLSNIGGMATMIGDPPNIMIGSAVPELSFLDFIVNLAPLAILCMMAVIPLLCLIYRKQLKTTPELQEKVVGMSLDGIITDKVLLVKSLTVLGLTILGFFLHSVLHLESATIALTGAFILLLLTGEHAMENALKNVEWTTIFFFVGLFILVGGLIETGVIEELAASAMELTGGDVTATAMLILWMSALASAFLDNIPFTATMIPLIEDMGNMGISNLEPLWWALAMGACLGGNGTVIGASANLIGASMAQKEGYNISFMQYLKVGLPLMLLTILIATVYLYFVIL